MKKTDNILPAVLAIAPEYVERVRTLAILGYSRERVAVLLGLPRKETKVLLVRLSIPGDELYEAYESGFASGEMNIDAELVRQAENGDTAAIKLLEERKNERYFKDLRKELFGI